MRWGRPAVLGLLVSLAAAVAFAGTLDHGMVYDDHRFVEGNAHLSAVAGAPWTAFDPGTTGMDGAEPGMWRPLRTLSFAFDRLVFGGGPAGFHLCNVLLHGAATGLLFAVAMAIGLDDLGAAAGAAIFALHPAQAECVSWISSRGDLLSAVLVLGAVLLHLRRFSPAGSAALVGLAFLAKEAAVAAPLLMAAADFAAGGTARVKERWRPVAAAAGILLVLAAVRYVVLAGAGADAGQGAGLGLSAAQRIGALPAMLGWYVRRVFAPSPGAFDFQLEPADAGLALLALGVLVIAALPKSVLPGRAERPIRAAVLWSLAALVPVTLLQVVLPLKILVADRFLYLALAGPALAVGALARGLGENAARGAFVGSALLLLASFPAMERWHSDETLWADTLDRLPGDVRAVHGLANAREDRPEEAIGLYRRVANEEPDNVIAWYRMGILEEGMSLRESDPVMRRGRALSAAASLFRAVYLWKGGVLEGRERGRPDAQLTRACLLASLGQDAEAADEAADGAALLASAPAGVAEKVRPRLRILQRWAEEKGRNELLLALETAAQERPR